MTFMVSRETAAVVSARPTTEVDLEYVMAAERAPGTAEFVLQWSRPQHLAAMSDVGALHWIIESPLQDDPVGFVIICRDAWHGRGFEFKRLVITEKGQGYGRATLRLVKRAMFDRFDAHRLWLEVFDHNDHARRLYESEGFIVEGTRRECVRHRDRYVAVVMMSMLEREYRASG